MNFTFVGSYSDQAAYNLALGLNDQADVAVYNISMCTSCFLSFPASPPPVSPSLCVSKR